MRAPAIGFPGSLATATASRKGASAAGATSLSALGQPDARRARASTHDRFTTRTMPHFGTAGSSRAVDSFRFQVLQHLLDALLVLVGPPSADLGELHLDGPAELALGDVQRLELPESLLQRAVENLVILRLHPDRRRAAVPGEDRRIVGVAKGLPGR